MAMPESNALARNLAIGFIAGALSVATFQQVILLVLTAIHMINAHVYSMAPIRPWGVPSIFNAMFWGGLWGVVFALIVDRAPRGMPLWVFGLIFGAIGPVLVLWFVVFPLRGQPVAAGFAPMRMLAHIIIHAVFGLGVALIYSLLRDLASGRRRALRM
jgi:hypothetical protein